MAIFQRVTTDAQITENGELIRTMGWGLNLEGYDTPIATSHVHFEFDAEDLVNATEVVIEFEGDEFILSLNEMDETDWEVIEEIFHPE